MSKMPVVKVSQLEKALYNLSKNIKTKEDAYFILLNYQRKNHIFLTEDGYALTKQAYIISTNDRGLNDVNKNDLLPKMENTLKKKKLLTNHIYALNFVIDLLPDSLDFIVNTYPPILLSFEYQNHNGDNIIYEIIKFNDDIFLTKELLRNMPKYLTEEKEKVIRIAIIDNEDIKKSIPYYGIKYICKIDNRNHRGYKVLEEREGDLWKELY